GREAALAARQGASVDRLPARCAWRASGYPLRLPLGLAAHRARRQMSQRGDTIAYVVSGLAILAFAVLLVFALARLIETENEMRRNEGDNMLWAISQAQTAALILDAALARQASGVER